MHRLHVTSEQLACATPQLPPAAARHLKVVRPKAGETVELFDGRGRTRAYVWSPAGLAAAGPVVAHPAPEGELTLFACVTKGSRWDWTIEKAVELGVTRLVPVLSARCIVRLAPAERAAKAERWRRIAEDAARQSAAVWLPEIEPAVDFDAALVRVRAAACVYVGALTAPPPPSLWTALTAQPLGGDVGFFVGPEGDFTPEELAALLACAHPVSLGPTILRAETAALYGLTLLAAARYARMAQPC